VNHGRVIAAAECLADFHQLHLQEFARQEHRDLAWYRERLDARLRPEPLGCHAPAACHHFLDLFDRDQDFDGILKEVKSYSDIGGRIMFGTDIGFLPDYASLTKEFGYLARAGLSFSQILASLTTVPAERLGFGGSVGVIKRGMDADLLVLDGDPAKDQSAFYRVALTLREGRVIYRKGM